MKTARQTAVINTCSGSVRNAVFVSAGKLIVDGDISENETNIGFREPIVWNLIRNISKRTYSLGVQKVIKIDFRSPSMHLVSGLKAQMTIASKYIFGGSQYRLNVSVYCAPATETKTI